MGDYTFKISDYGNHTLVFNNFGDEVSPHSLVAEIYSLQSQLSEASREASGLAMSLWKNHYKDESPNFGLCDTVAGIITQIDNMVAGINEQLSEANGKADKYFKKCEDLHSEVMGVRCELSEARAHCERLRSALFQVSTCGLRKNGFFDKDLGKLIDGALEETPEQSLSEVKAQAIEQEVIEKILAIEPGINPDRCCVSMKELREIAARLRQQTSETPDERSCMYSEYDEAE